jgi:hypothetical protein
MPDNVDAGPAKDFMGLPVNHLEEYAVQHYANQWETDPMPLKTNDIAGEQCCADVSLHMAMSYNKEENVVPFFDSCMSTGHSTRYPQLQSAGGWICFCHSAIR